MQTDANPSCPSKRPMIWMSRKPPGVARSNRSTICSHWKHGPWLMKSPIGLWPTELLLAPNGRILLSTVAENAEMMKELLDVEPQVRG